MRKEASQRQNILPVIETYSDLTLAGVLLNTFFMSKFSPYTSV